MSTLICGFRICRSLLTSVQPGQRAHLRRETLRGSVQLLGVRALYRELVEGLALQPADADRRIVPQKRGDAGHHGKLGAQFVDDLVHLRALGARLQPNVQTPLVQGPAARADRRTSHMRPKDPSPGSRRSAFWCSTIASKEIPSMASVVPLIWSISSLGRKPFGMITPR